MNATATRAPKQAKKPARTCKWLYRRSCGEGYLEIVMKANSKSPERSVYAASPIPFVSFGPAYMLEKLAVGADGKHTGEVAERYCVNLHEHGSCECLGFLRHGRCKHLDCLSMLEGTGRL